ncbi:hypothetical protein [Vibrio sp. D431a]|uniref:hypothetical protein n=1 Tax=Vibrio sp. D431a TaxID=2837388 RepID=UPI002555210E|nr:hypothetical protein [Vibrio sp. D431a]MDK9789914.1 hypothetical protein [Vibrio sp. D431a]
MKKQSLEISMCFLLIAWAVVCIVLDYLEEDLSFSGIFNSILNIYIGIGALILFKEHGRGKATKYADIWTWPLKLKSKD